jgi:hypothetical protein
VSTPLTKEERAGYRSAARDAQYPEWSHSSDWPITIMASVLVRLLDEVEELLDEVEDLRAELEVYDEFTNRP